MRVIRDACSIPKSIKNVESRLTVLGDNRTGVEPISDVICVKLFSKIKMCTKLIV